MKNVLLYYTQPSMPICYCRYFYTKVLSIHLEPSHMLEYRRSYFTCILWAPVLTYSHTLRAPDPSWNTSCVGMLKIVFYMYFMTTSANIYSYTTCPGSILKHLMCWNVEDRILHVFYDHQCQHLFIHYVPRIHLETPHVLEYRRSYFTCILWRPVPTFIHTLRAPDPSWNTSSVGMLKIVFYMYFKTTSADMLLMIFIH